MTLQVKSAMTQTVVTVRPETTVDDACSLLLRHRISGLPVVDETGQLVGIVTEQDFLSLLADPSCDHATQRVSDFMQREVMTVGEDDRVTEVADLFRTRRIRRIPVVRGKQLVGVLSRRDLIRFIREVRERVRATLQSTPTPPQPVAGAVS